MKGCSAFSIFTVGYKLWMPTWVSIPLFNSVNASLRCILKLVSAIPQPCLIQTLLIRAFIFKYSLISDFLVPSTSCLRGHYHRLCDGQEKLYLGFFLAIFISITFISTKILLIQGRPAVNSSIKSSNIPQNTDRNIFSVAFQKYWGNKSDMLKRTQTAVT